ncbi:hypothetical protein BDZ97DRAFT_1770609 [Flammula alnicola]|nr:hypothetical protein BDZ97DRAFT_1770609 [Flammula alnicola]
MDIRGSVELQGETHELRDPQDKYMVTALCLMVSFSYTFMLLYTVPNYIQNVTSRACTNKWGSPQQTKITLWHNALTFDKKKRARTKCQSVTFCHLYRETEIGNAIATA